MVLEGGDPPAHATFADLPALLRPGDVLVVNDSRVMRARLRARRATGGAVELVLLGPGPGPVEALARPARKLRRGDVLRIGEGEGEGEGEATATVLDEAVDGVVRVAIAPDPLAVMEAHGRPPLPPYIRREADDISSEGDIDLARYQTVYAGPLGSAAAPTAGLHFDPPLIEALEAAGIELCAVTLHVGLGTFRPLRPEDVARGELHAEPFDVPAETAARIAAARARGGRAIAVGTTSARTLEAATPAGHRVPAAGSGVTRLFVRPPYRFRTVDALVTNFHIPRSSLLMLVAALVGRERLLGAYAEAVRAGYRFYSYGDAMLVRP
jgi:S-adenosylmethionine:tRNA ribosyltransferase-isomerase